MLAMPEKNPHRSATMNGAPTQLDAPTSDDYWKNEYKRRADFGKSAAASVLLRTQVLTLSEYRNEARRPPLPRETLIAQYGSIFVPIPISLADEETLEDYEMSFQDWLVNRGIKTSDLKRDARLERTLRCDFALLKATGGKGSSSVAKPQVPSRVIAPAPTTVHVNKKKEKVRKPTSAFVPVAKQAEAKEESSKQIPVPEDPYGFPECCSVQLPPSSATLEALITAYTGCGCRNCLRHCTLRMAERVTQLEEADRASRAVKHKKRARIEPDEPPSPPTQPAAIIESNEQTTNRPDDFDFSLIGLASKRARLLEATSTVPSSHRTQSTEDPIETRLIHRFDKLNELALTSERKLETLMAEKPNNHPKKKLTKVHELQQKISSDKEARAASLVVAVVYLWRHDEKELLEMASTSENPVKGSAVGGNHQEIATIALQLKGKRLELDVTRSQLDQLLMQPLATGDDDHRQRLTELGERIARLEREIRLFASVRRQCFALLVRTDAIVRRLIRNLFATAP